MLQRSSDPRDELTHMFLFKCTTPRSRNAFRRKSGSLDRLTTDAALRLIRYDESDEVAGLHRTNENPALRRGLVTQYALRLALGVTATTMLAALA